jgi:hypothetical protein
MHYGPHTPLERLAHVSYAERVRVDLEDDNVVTILNLVPRWYPAAIPLQLKQVARPEMAAMKNSGRPRGAAIRVVHVLLAPR